MVDMVLCDLQETIIIKSTHQRKTINSIYNYTIITLPVVR